MERIVQTSGLHKETDIAIQMLYKNTKTIVRSPDGDSKFFHYVTGVLQGDTLLPYLFIHCIDYVFQTSIDMIKENSFILKKGKK